MPLTSRTKYRLFIFRFHNGGEQRDPSGRLPAGMEGSVVEIRWDSGHGYHPAVDNRVYAPLRLVFLLLPLLWEMRLAFAAFR